MDDLIAIGRWELGSGALPWIQGVKPVDALLSPFWGQFGDRFERGDRGGRSLAL